jgi:hypothetical protein
MCWYCNGSRANFVGTVTVLNTDTSEFVGVVGYIAHTLIGTLDSTIEGIKHSQIYSFIRQSTYKNTVAWSC